MFLFSFFADLSHHSFFFRRSGLRCRVRGEASDLNFLFFFVCSCSLVVETISDSLPQSVFFFEFTIVAPSRSKST